MARHAVMGGRVVLAVLVSALLPGCRQAPPPPPPLVPVVQTMGTWEGRGDHTIGITSHSGKFQIRWRTTEADDAMAPGVFRVTVHSAVSGRPLHEVISHVGAGSGVVDYEEDPRQFNLMIASADLDWVVTVDATVLTRS